MIWHYVAQDTKNTMTKKAYQEIKKKYIYIYIYNDKKNPKERHENKEYNA